MDAFYSKYYGEQDLDLYGGTVVGRSPSGFPIVGGGVPHLTQAESEAIPHVSNFHADWFRMWEPADRARFVAIMDHVSNGEFFVKRRLDVPVPDFPRDEPGGSLKVWLEWVQVEARPVRSPFAMQQLPPAGGEAFAAHFPLGHGG